MIYVSPHNVRNKSNTNVLIDFIDTLPHSKGKTSIFLVGDRLSKYSHFIPISHPYTTAIIVLKCALNKS